MKFSKKTSHIDISGIRKMFELAKGEDIINLGLGEPDFPIPVESKKAIIKALKDDFTHYTPSKGIIELREAISRKLSGNGIPNEPGEVIVTSGASEALEISLLSLVDEGDEVIIPDPGFVSYAPLTRIAGGVPVPFKVDDDEGFQINPKIVESKITKRTKAIIINSPANPTGAVSEKKDVKEIAKIADENELVIISDEVYDEITYGKKHYSAGRFSDRVITVNSFSKSFAMTGLRLGYLHAKKDAVEEILKIHQFAQASACSISQAAALAALKSGEGFTKKMVKILKQRRDLIVKLLNDIEGIKCLNPDGAFYVFPNVSSFGNSSALVMDILKETGVIVTPGNAFGEWGEGFMRLSYATSEENIIKGLGRLTDYLNIYMEPGRKRGKELS
jgi:aspartate aminotransferase